MPEEISTFIGYEEKGNEVVAKFCDRYEKEFFLLTKEACEKRLENAVKYGHLHDQTLAALNGWPER